MVMTENFKGDYDGHHNESDDNGDNNSGIVV